MNHFRMLIIHTYFDSTCRLHNTQYTLFASQNFWWVFSSISLGTTIKSRKIKNIKVMQNLGVQTRCILGNLEMANSFCGQYGQKVWDYCMYNKCMGLCGNLTNHSSCPNTYTCDHQLSTILKCSTSCLTRFQWPAMTRENKFTLLFTYTRLFYVSAFSS